jgi:hypothetical protein
MVSVPDVDPGDVGSEATVIVQLAPTAREVPQLLVSEKPPVLEMPLMVAAELPLFVRVTVWVPLVCPTRVPPNDTLPADVTTGHTPVPVREITWGVEVALSAIMSAPMGEPIAVGEKVTLIVQEPLAATLPAQLLV